jgi:hypothetical protein
MKRVAIWLTALCTVLAASAQNPALAQLPATSVKDQVRADLKAPAVPGQFLVKFKPGLAAAQRAAIAEELGAKMVDRVAVLDVDVLEFPALSANADAGGGGHAAGPEGEPQRGLRGAELHLHRHLDPQRSRALPAVGVGPD